MHAREGQQHQQYKSRQLQRGLYLAAKRSRNRRFHALFDRIYRPDILRRAWQEVRANGGAAGVDGVTLQEVEAGDVELFLQAIQSDLRSGKYTYRSQCCGCIYQRVTDGSGLWEYRR